MSYKIAIASGKGGTGKTSVAVNLYHFFVQRVTNNIQLLDCDVEEPNDVLFFKTKELVSEQVINQKIPKIDEQVCVFCRKCSDWCEYNAITIIPPVKFVQVNDVLCHSCGACVEACKEGALIEVEHPIGKVTNFDIGAGKGLLEGKLRIGSAMQTMLIKELKKCQDTEVDIVIYDAPPGTSCSVVESVIDADFVVLVTEPTPFGLNDLKLTVNLMLELGKAFGILINKSGLGSDDTLKYINNNQFELLGEIPFARDFAKYYAEGKLGDQLPKELALHFEKVVENINQKMFVHEGNHHS